MRSGERRVTYWAIWEAAIFPWSVRPKGLLDHARPMPPTKALSNDLTRVERRAWRATFR